MGGAYKLHHPHPQNIHFLISFFLLAIRKLCIYTLSIGYCAVWIVSELGGDTSDTSLDYSVEGPTALQTSLLWLVGQRSHELVWMFRQCFVVGSCF